MDRSGFFRFGFDGAFSLAALERAKRIVVEVNPKMPRTFGAGLVHVSDVHAIVEGTSAIPTLDHAALWPLDEQIANTIVSMTPDRYCAQFGIGGVPYMVASKLPGLRD